MATSDRASLEKIFPGLRKGEYRVTSSRSATYNCIAWAAGDDTIRWDPAPWYYWPRRIPRNLDAKTVVLLFESLGYSVCSDARFEFDFERVSVFARASGHFTHVARQLDGGMWTSKLGKLEDIEPRLVALEGQEYGRVETVLRRSVR